MKKLLFFSLMLSHSLTYTGIMSYAKWQNGEKVVHMFGNSFLSIEYEDIYRKQVKTDQHHKTLFMDLIYKLAKKKEVSTFNIEGPKDFEKNYLIELETKQNKRLKKHIGSNIFLKHFAHDNNYKYGSVAMNLYDDRTYNLNSPTQFYANLGDIYTIAQQRPEILSLIQSGELDSVLKTMVSDVTAQEYMNELKSIGDKIHNIEKRKQFDDVCARIQHKLQIIGASPQESVFNIFLDALKKNVDVNEIDSEVMDVNGIIGKISIEDALYNNESENAIFFAAYDNARAANVWCKENGFENITHVGQGQELNPAEEYEELTVDQVQSIFSDICGMPENSCTVCAKKSDKKCSRCKLIKYCSAQCQKEDWSTHKGSCFNAKKYE